jgi:hypothetical protein
VQTLKGSSKRGARKAAIPIATKRGVVETPKAEVDPVFRTIG